VAGLRIGLAAALSILAGASLAGAAGYKPPRTASGDPDLQGVWTNVSMTMLQRPKAFETLVISAAQATAYEKVKTDRFEEEIAPLAPETAAPPPVDTVEQEAAQWYLPPAGLARIGGQVRTSWIVDPADGRLPYTEAARAEAKATEDADDHVFDNPEARPFDERCLLGVGGSAGPPFLNTASNSHLQIVQTSDHVVIVAEMNHDARIVRLRDRRHAPAAVKPWMGDSIGWWEGDTLVVETTNFNPGERWHWNSGYVLIAENAKVVERFTRTGPAEILYRFRVEDPVNYTQAWRGEMPLRAAAGPVYEYACHEGNYALANILAGGRAAQRTK
jgi:hypothetical protein